MELKLDAAKWRRKQGMKRLLVALGADEGLTRYVGGAVRDDLLGLEVNDVDLATRIEPDDVVDRLEKAKIKAVPTGIEHGTITAVADGHPYEVTTLRRDVTTDGRRATVAFTDDWEEDAARRDFTINALSADTVTGEIFDYFGGLADLHEGRVRFIGDPLRRIAEDHLRILRFFRFHARYGSGTEPDQDALEACTERANDLMALSRERIADELLKLLAMPDPSSTVAIMLDRAILKPVLPEVSPNKVADLRALIAAEQRAEIEPDPLRRLASLLPRDPAVEGVAARLKLSNKARKRLGCSAGTDLGDSPQALAYRLGIECAVDRLLLAGNDTKAREIAGWQAPRLPISGGQLISRGLPEGPIVAKTLRQIEDRWVAGGFPQGPAFETIVVDALAQAKV